MKSAIHEQLSHGLRTPLTSVLGFTATLLEQWDDLPDADRLCFVRMVYAESLRMSNSVEQVDRQLYHALAAQDPCSGPFKHRDARADAA